ICDVGCEELVLYKLWFGGSMDCDGGQQVCTRVGWVAGSYEYKRQVFAVGLKYLTKRKNK
ncbi:hypothetical protein, partial [Staphylococcus aureus]|uniref:hypothetical protein n=1 Tax=Staphylococcus aureus TaxID=1280 RepID=UPI00193AC935